MKKLPPATPTASVKIKRCPPLPTTSAACATSTPRARLSPKRRTYGTLETHLNELGRGLRPRVRAIINLKNRGAGIPDGGLFSEDQLPGGDAVGTGGTPARGVLEVK